jgi:hypothetical protein
MLKKKIFCIYYRDDNGEGIFPRYSSVFLQLVSAYSSATAILIFRSLHPSCIIVDVTFEEVIR